MTHARRLAALERSFPTPKPDLFPPMTAADRARALCRLYLVVGREAPGAVPSGYDFEELRASLDRVSEDEAERMANEFIERVRDARLQEELDNERREDASRSESPS